MFILPPHPLPATGLTIGLFGGSFDPVHDGHFLVAERALQLLRLDAVWWLPTLQNPLKTQQAKAFDERVRHLQALVTHPKMHVLPVEAQLHSVYTLNTITQLQRSFPQVTFVLVIGLDSAYSFHRWHHWRDIVDLVPIMVINRAPQRLGGATPRLRLYRKARHVTLRKRTALAENRSNLVLWDGGGPTSASSSTRLRQRNKA